MKTLLYYKQLIKLYLTRFKRRKEVLEIQFEKDSYPPIGSVVLDNLGTAFLIVSTGKIRGNTCVMKVLTVPESELPEPLKGMHIKDIPKSLPVGGTFFMGGSFWTKRADGSLVITQIQEVYMA